MKSEILRCKKSTKTNKSIPETEIPMTISKAFQIEVPRGIITAIEINTGLSRFIRLNLIERGLGPIWGKYEFWGFSVLKDTIEEVITKINSIENKNQIIATLPYSDYHIKEAYPVGSYIFYREYSHYEYECDYDYDPVVIKEEFIVTREELIVIKELLKKFI